MSNTLNQAIIDDINSGTNIEAFLIWQWLVNSQQFSAGDIDPAAILNQTKEKLLEATSSPEAAAWISHINFTRKLSRKFGEIAMYNRELTNVESSVEALALYPDNDFKQVHLEVIQESLSKKAGDAVSTEIIDSYIQETSAKLDELRQKASACT
tara:strand:- start:92 stop:553 length:462 start_codon:yes stop_codon:yes gene_type:complete